MTSCADWDGLHDHLRDIPWEDILRLGSYAAASEFCEGVQVEIDVYIISLIVNIRSGPWFSAAFAADIAHRNLFFLFIPTEQIF